MLVLKLNAHNRSELVLPFSTLVKWLSIYTALLIPIQLLYCRHIALEYAYLEISLILDFKSSVELVLLRAGKLAC